MIKTFDRFLMASVAALALGSCSAPVEEDVAAEPVAEKEKVVPEVVAAFGEGDQITRADIDEAILRAPASQRVPGDTPFAEWYGAWVEEAFLHRVLLAEAVEQEIDRSPNFLAEARTLRRNVYTDSRLRSEMAKLPPFTEEEIAARTDDKIAELQRPETRQIYHIFRRFGDAPGASREAILDQLETVRNRFADGENFGRIAQEISDSESRHKNGLLGWIAPGQIAEAAEKVIFSLAEGEVSEPLVSGDGVHLFFNENTRAAYDPAPEEVRGPVVQDLTYLRAVNTLEKLVETMSIETTRFVPEEAEFKKLLRSDDPETVVFALGTFELPLAEFRRIFSSTIRQLRGKKLPVDDLPLAIFEEIKNREILYQSMLADTDADYSGYEARFAASRDDLLVQQQMRRRMVTWVGDEPGLLEDYFRNNRKRFDAPAKIRLAGLRIPIDATAPSKMALLENARSELESGQADWKTVGESVGQEAADWGWFGPNELLAFDRTAARRAYGMKVGDFSPPYTQGGRIVMFEVVDRDKGVPAAFDKVRSAVADQYVSEKLPEVREKVVRQIEEEYGFREFPDHFPNPIERLDKAAKP